MPGARSRIARTGGQSVAHCTCDATRPARDAGRREGPSCGLEPLGSAGQPARSI